jgi:peptidoglycan-N-acetylglucosamine deacetylase
MTSAAPYAVVSCDVDTVDRHLAGYGFDGLPPCDGVYRSAVPRLLELFAELDIPCVMFVIARDAGTQRALLRRMSASGHEIGSHSLTHPQGFRTLDGNRLWLEIDDSRSRLADAAGTDVQGFRAPGWDVDGRVLGMVRDSGYRYDASVFPTPMVVANRLLTFSRGRGPRWMLSPDVLRQAFAARRPHRLRRGAAGLVEFPMTVTRWLRLPLYHTFGYLIPRYVFLAALERALRSSVPICYELHAADLADVTADRLDERLVRHPGMTLPVEVRRSWLGEVLGRIARRRRMITYRRVLEEGLAA